MAEFKARPPKPFNPFISNFTQFSDWRQEFDIYILASTHFAANVAVPLQQARLFNLAGPEFMKFAKQLIVIVPATTVEAILNAVAGGLKPKRFDLQNRGKLFELKQRPNVSATKFLQELRDLYALANYPDAVPKDILLRDLFIAGSASIDAKRLLFQQDADTLTIDKCIHLVSSFESASLNQSLAETETQYSLGEEVSVSAVQTNRQKLIVRCHGCGQQPAQHSRNKCPAYSLTCRNCGKLGHFAKVCRQIKINAIDENTSENITVAAVTSGSTKRFLQASINGKQIKMLIDSGSDLTIISANIAKQLGLKFSAPLHHVPDIRGANGSSIRMLGTIQNACIETPQGYLIDTVWVAANLTSDAILGQSSLSAFEALTIQYGGRLPNLLVNHVSTDSKTLFANHPPVTCFAHVDTSVQPLRAPSRRQSVADKDFIRRELLKLQKDGKIRQSISSWRSQAFVVHEAGRKPRMVIDYAQTVNRVTPLDAFPVPLVSDVLEQVSQFKFFSYIDLKSAFHQFRIDPSESHFTAFEADKKLWEFTCIPFGLRNSPAAFNRALQEIIGNLPGVVVYMDDVVVGGKNIQEHDANLQTLFKRATEANLTLSTEKCVLRKKTLRFLGHIISDGTISPDPQRAAPFVQFPVPTTVKQLERFVGLSVYHAKWIPNFSKVMDPLFSALQSKALPLSDAALHAMQQVKQSIQQAILYIVDPELPLSLSTDASGTAIGAVLSQEGRPVAFMSRRLSATQQRWSPAELEGYAVVQACQLFRHYLTNRPFNILCDQHGFVKALNSDSTRGVKNAKFARWRIELAEFEFTIQHLPGKLNTAADAFSRIASVSSDPAIRIAQSRHEQYGHPGKLRLIGLLRSTNEADSISNLEEVCEKVCSTCRICAEVKPRWLKPPRHQVINSTGPWQRISMDFMTNKPTSAEGYTNVLTIIDEFSRFPFAFPTKDRSSATIIRILTTLFTLFGPCVSIHSDRGAEFISVEVSSFLASWNVHQSRTTPYFPAGNGQTERFNGIIWKTVQCLLANRQLPRTAWPSVLNDALHSIRSLITTATGSSPHNQFLRFDRRFRPQTTTVPMLTHDFAWLRRHVRNKNDPSGDLVKVIASYPGYAVISRDGQSTDTVNWRHLAPHPGPIALDKVTHVATPAAASSALTQATTTTTPTTSVSTTTPPITTTEIQPMVPSQLPTAAPPPSGNPPLVHHYTTQRGRVVKPPERFGYGENVTT